ERVDTEQKFSEWVTRHVGESEKHENEVHVVEEYFANRTTQPVRHPAARHQHIPSPANARSTINHYLPPVQKSRHDTLNPALLTCRSRNDLPI
ncbi:hypothetical protein, partial [Prauserella halophila]|uniref:hypothetical protein n=1 Tax=Prauserella halophila TaxID=185641 RepID=UPI0031D34A27